jgi:ascorbate-specific PTS system EIIC-type component UlaA
MNIIARSAAWASGKRRSMTQGMQMRLTAIRGFLCLLVSAGSGVDIANARQLEKALKLWTNTAADSQPAQFSIANGELMFRELAHECFGDEVRAKITEIFPNPILKKITRQN